MGVTWRWHAIIRVLIVILSQAGLSVLRIRLEDENINLGLVWICQILLIVTLETSIYINMKASARFFLKIKTIEQ